MNVRPLFIVGLLCGSALARDVPIAQEWVSYVNLGTGTSEGGKCLYREFEERRYIVTPDATGPLSGIYANIWHVRWLRRNDPKCAYPGLPPRAMYMGNRTWGLSIVPAGPGRFVARAEFNACVGDICDLPDVPKAPFVTSLMVAGAALHDLDAGADGKTAIAFTPIVQAQQEAAAAAHQFVRDWRALKGSEPPLDVLFDPTTRDGEMLGSIVRQYHTARLKNSTGYRLIESYRLDAGTQGNLPVPLLHFSIGNQQMDGSSAGEIYELAQRGGVWRLVNLRY